jgi:Bacterial protein of unknown function (DUF937)
MAQDLVTQILQGFGSDTMDRMSAATGVDRETTHKVVGGAVPAILAGLVGVVSRPGGADRLSSMVGQLGKFGISQGTLGPMDATGQRTLMEQGSSQLSSLFGSQGVDGLVGTFAHYTGLDQGVIGRLLGFATPLVLGLLGRSAQTAGGGAGGLASLLLGQKDAIATALPAGLANRLQGSGLLSGIADRLGQPAAAATAAAKSSAAAMGQSFSDAKSTVSDMGAKVAQSATSYGKMQTSSAGLPRWLWSLAAAIIIAIAAYWIWGRGQIQEASRLPVDTSTQTTGSGTSTPVGAMDLGKQLTGAFDNTRQALQQVSDPASAKAALPQLNDAVAQLDKLQSAAAQASDEQRKTIAAMVDKAQPGLQNAIDHALATPGVAEVLKPTLDAFKSKLEALGSAT